MELTLKYYHTFLTIFGCIPKSYTMIFLNGMCDWTDATIPIPLYILRDPNPVTTTSCLSRMVLFGMTPFDRSTLMGFRLMVSLHDVG